MKKNIFLTGATGVMGWAGFQELLQRKDKFDITILVRPSTRNRRRLRPYMSFENVRIVWGDLTSYKDVESCVKGADYVLHVGGMVSPKADSYPEITRKTNILGAENIIKAVKAQPNPNDIKVVNIGSVAQTGDRNPPLHWGRTGDPLSISIYDDYAVTKTVAERIFAESGLKYWVSLRQSGILHAGILKNFNPIMFHVPLNGVLEWSTKEDSARLLANVCEDWVPESFWRNFYNIGSGKSYRLTNYEFECKVLRAAYCPAPEKIFEPQWFCLRNFHGQWFEDSDKLENILHFRAGIPCDEYFERLGKQLPSYFRLAKLVPAKLMKFVLKRLASSRPFGPLYWIKTADQERIEAYFGNMDSIDGIRNWNDIDLRPPRTLPIRLYHGYDETKPQEQLSIEDMRGAARYRGGECLSLSMHTADLDTPLEWKCHEGHIFKASPRLILYGGHWCEKCLCISDKRNYDRIVENNPFMAQVRLPHRNNQKSQSHSNEQGNISERT